MKPIIHVYSSEVIECQFLILAAGFEERAFQFLNKTHFSDTAYCIFVSFDNDSEENKETYSKFKNKINESFNKLLIREVTIKHKELQYYESELEALIKLLPYDIGDAWIDISGMPSHAICSTLNVLRTNFKNKKQIIIYTAASSYFPTFSEFQTLKGQTKGEIEFLPQSMAKELSEVIMLKSFLGYRSKEGTSCLAVFAGYDSPRSSGVIEQINPSLLLLIYGKPALPELNWRLDLSRELHRKFETTRRTAIEEVSTLDLNESIRILENYYEYLFEDYDFTVSPICSKMQVVGVYLFWERYKEVQLVFPLPIEYDFKRRPIGIEKTYITLINPRDSLYNIQRG